MNAVWVVTKYINGSEDPILAGVYESAEFVVKDSLMNDLHWIEHQPNEWVADYQYENRYVEYRLRLWKVVGYASLAYET